MLAGAATSFVDRGGLARITPGLIVRDLECRFVLDSDRAIPTIQDNPIIGASVGNYSQALSERMGPSPADKLRRVTVVHSSVLLVAA